MEEWRSRDVDQVDVVSGQQLLDALDVGNTETLGRRVCGCPVGSRHPDELHAGHLRELLQGVEAESTAADDGQSYVSLIHRSLQV